MDLIRWSITRPVAVSVVVMLVVLFGLIGLVAIPVQLTPTVDRSVVTVDTIWPGRGPEEVVDEITRKQEQQLKNVANLRSMRSVSRQGGNTISLEFALGSDITRALQDVADALRRVPSYPEDVSEPTVKAAEDGAIEAIAWLIIDLDPAKAAEHPGFDISTLYTAVDRELRPYLERVEGVAEVNVYGGRERQAHVRVEPAALASRGLTHQDVVDALRRENVDTSAGTVDEGKREIRVRVVGQFRSVAEIESTVIAYRDAKPVYVRDVGSASLGHERSQGFVRSLGRPCLALPVIRQGGVNVMEVMERLRARLDEARRDLLPRLHPTAGKDLRLSQVYDETEYIRSAIDLVLSNLWTGGALATLVLLLFIRSFRATGIIALAIPISVIATFLAVLAAGRTLNVVSLAGLAFSTGMVVDNAIVVLENIMRRRALGDEPFDAVYRGTREIWTAILASTLTTIAVFIPILTIRDEAGQLFFDLSLALAFAVSFSLIAAITVVPCAAGLLFRSRALDRRGPLRTAWHELFGVARLAAALGGAFARWIEWLITGWRRHALRPAVVLTLALGSIAGSLWLMPPLDYLPAGNQNLVFGGMLIPPGVSQRQQQALAERIEAVVEPYMRADAADPKKLAELPPIFNFQDPAHPFAPVGVKEFFIGSFRGIMFCGGISRDRSRVVPVGALLTGAMNSVPDAFGFAAQASIFSNLGGGNTINIEISGPDLDRVSAAAGMVMGQAYQKYQRAQPDPANFNLRLPEAQVRVNDRGRDLGLRSSDVGVAVRSLFDGANAGEYIDQGRTIDVLVKPPGDGEFTRDNLASVPVATPSGALVPLSSVVDVVETRVPQEIRRIEELPAVTVQVSPPEGRPIQEVMDEIRREVVGPAEAAGLIDSSMRVRMEGTAAKLTQVRTALFGESGDAGSRRTPVTVALRVAAYAALVLGAVVGAWCLRRAAAGRAGRRASVRWYALLGSLLVGSVVGGLLLALADQPQLLMARSVWALMVTYLLMCALFESFLYPFVIMFSVPLGTIGGFGALRLVHEWTKAQGTMGVQQLDVLTMIGFIILVGTVVNNAILIVEQTLNFMDPAKLGEAFAGETALPATRAIRESVRTRLRPIFMTSLTTLGGGLPLVLAPGAGSEIYRGLGAVVCGGLLVSTIFTLVVVPLTLSIALDVKEGWGTLFARPHAEGAPGARVIARAPGGGDTIDGRDGAMGAFAGNGNTP